MANIGLAKAGHKMVSYFRIVPELNPLVFQSRVVM